MPIPVTSVRVTHEFRDSKDNWVPVAIPLDRVRLATLENQRNGGDMKLTFDFELSVDELVVLKRLNLGYNSVVWGLKDHHSISANHIQIVIPRSNWINQVLPATGYGKIHIIELPAIPIESSSQLRAAHSALLQAQEMYNQGFYDDTVGKCRLALEPFFEVNEAKKMILKTSWETRLGKATYNWLNEASIALKQPTNRPHHSPAMYFNRLAAQMLLAVTTAVVVLCGASATPESPSS